jgi:hypothetical protein
MNRTLFLSTALLTALAALPAPTPAEAASDGALLLRCKSPDGTVGYTDRSCAVFGAKAVPIDAELVSRIVRDRARHARMEAAAAGAEPGFDMGSAMRIDDTYASTTTPGRRSPASGCARSPAQLATDLHASVALGDVNRIAESYHFAGMSTAAGERVLDRLQRYAGRAVVDSSYYAATIGPAKAGGSDDGDAAGVLQLEVDGQDGGAAAVDFDVERYAGCYFVSFA